MKRMSFALTKRQLLDGSKDVTRRLGWYYLCAPGPVDLLAVSKCMGLKPGTTADIYGVVRKVTAWRERLDAITPEDVVREGFPEKTTEEFITFFISSNRRTRDINTGLFVPVTRNTIITRFEFSFFPVEPK